MSSRCQRKSVCGVTSSPWRRAGRQPGCRGKQRAVTRAQLRALDLTTQDLELMAQHEQLDVLDVNGPPAADQ